MPVAPANCTQDVSNAVWSLAALRVRPGVPLLQRLALRALEVRRELTPQVRDAYMGKLLGALTATPGDLPLRHPWYGSGSVHLL